MMLKYITEKNEKRNVQNPCLDIYEQTLVTKVTTVNVTPCWPPR